MRASGKRIALIFATALAVSVGACGGPEVPAEPTWERDIHPLMVARCIRCHDSPGHRDPLVTASLVARAAVLSFNYSTRGDIPDDTLMWLRKSAEAARGSLTPFPRMPPPPAEALEDWQIDMLQRWGADPR